MKRFLCAAIVACAFVANAFIIADAQTRRGRRNAPAVVCGDPTVRCRTGDLRFEPYDLPFRLPPRSVIYETEFFYAVILKSMRAGTDYGEDCETFIPEQERLEAQRLFPRNKVFASRCVEAGTLYYTNTTPNTRFMAVYAGRTRAEADRLLAQVRAMNRFRGANLRRMRAGFNGT